ncbi:MAG: 23S rRNA (pseudouridine(1915)-N(3))-methyltransferase RlmH [Rhodospirillaceae bacterium]|jgi:23S rRNA (pseudouridine1915-N3)-methyltransferase|nr:23S rRNA (pseudouridine(1915)-N(3))-methyltransferase RlmH [Rhodospirillaceae bacterium]MBT5455191.1 23S rRNA (pseudouridine(1915)-N(3))-methyltransferase RlmH [Rhodospirillaceae bacterium]
MRITVIAVGRIKAGPERTLAEHFQSRINWPVELREVEEKKKLPSSALREREGALLLAACPPGATVVALDEHGKALASRDFARRLGSWRDDGLAELAFVIGGADGLAKSVLDRAAQTISFGSMTWPHLLVRGMLFEQIYRAQQILAGHPYHRD